MADIPANSSTNATISVGGSIASTIITNGDRDWVRIDLAPGEWVQVNMNSTSGLDPFLRLRDADGNLVDLDDDSGSGANSSLVFGGGEGGTYYLDAGSFNNGSSGSYTLTATATSAPPGSPVDVLDGDVQIPAGSPTVVTVYFVPAGQTSNFGVNSAGDSTVSEGWTEFEIERVMAALGSIENVANIDFQISTDPNADFQMVIDSNELNDNGLLGYFYFPNGTGQSMGVFNRNGFGWDANGLMEGGLGYSTIVHEALHGLGLEHPHVDNDSDPFDDGFLGVDSLFGDFGINGLNQGIFTIMSYNGGWAGAPGTNNFGEAAGPMALDIAVIQDMYGANTSYNTGDNVYDLDGTNGQGSSWLSIWDAGGNDTIRFDGSQSALIDLREATLDYLPGGGGFVSHASGVAGGFTIANGANIENVLGGFGDDTIIGNGLSNDLSGRGGDDLLTAGSGSDTVAGDSGSDMLLGTSGTNLMYGGSGNDTIEGGTGSDTVYGGSGDDEINGNGNADFLFGGRGNDEINGGSGADQITGGLGADDLTGGGGADDFIFDFVSDSYAGGGDTIRDFQVGSDDIVLSNISGLTFIGTSGFSNTSGQVRLDVAGGNTTVLVDIDGDGSADMEIFLQGTTGLTSNDFIL